MSLSQRLARGLTSSHRANAVFQDPRSSLHGELDAAGAQTPGDDVLRLALNIAADQRRAGARKLAPDEIGALLEVGGEPASTETDLSLQELQLVLAELPEFTRAVLEAVLLDNAARSDIAKRFGVTVPTIDAEIQKALESGLQYLQQKKNGALKGF